MVNNLTSAPLPKLIKQIAVPASIGFFFNTMLNVVDTFYAGLVSTQAVAALSLSFPIFFVIIALGSGISTGNNALISNFLGEGNLDKAKRFVAQGLSFSLFVGLLCSIIGYFSAEPLLRILGAEGEYLGQALQYLNVIVWGTTIFILLFVMNSGLQAQGDTKSFRNTFIFSFILNLFLNPWFIFGGLGMPALGLAGIAYATLVVETVGVMYWTYRLIKSGLLCAQCFEQFAPRAKDYWAIAQQGFPASLNMMTVAIGIFIITYFIAPFGQLAVAAYGIATRIDQIALLPTIGLNMAALTLTGQNNGAKKFDRIRECIRLTIKYGLFVVVPGMILTGIFAPYLIDVFTEDPDTVEIGTKYLRISLFIYPAYLLLYLTTSVLQGLKKPNYAIWIGIYRQILLPALIFPFLIGLMSGSIFGIWWGIFIINWSATLISLWYLRRTFRKITQNPAILK